MCSQWLPSKFGSRELLDIFERNLFLIQNILPGATSNYCFLIRWMNDYIKSNLESWFSLWIVIYHTSRLWHILTLSSPPDTQSTRIFFPTQNPTYNAASIILMYFWDFQMVEKYKNFLRTKLIIWHNVKTKMKLEFHPFPSRWFFFGHVNTIHFLAGLFSKYLFLN